jgi:hypothetical protein
VPAEAGHVRIGPRRLVRQPERELPGGRRSAGTPRSSDSPRDLAEGRKRASNLRVGARRGQAESGEADGGLPGEGLTMPIRLPIRAFALAAAVAISTVAAPLPAATAADSCTWTLQLLGDGYT